MTTDRVDRAPQDDDRNRRGRQGGRACARQRRGRAVPPVQPQVERKSVRPRSTPHGFRPQSPIELLWWFLDTMEWSRTWQLLLLLTVPTAIVFAGLGLLAHVVVGTSAFWSAISGLALGGGTSAVTYGVTRRRQRQETQGQDADGADAPAPNQRGR